MTVNVVSDSVYLPKAHGIHTAFLNHVEMLKKKGVKVFTNSSKHADITHIHMLGLLGMEALLVNKHTVISAHLIPESFIGSLVGEQYWGKMSAPYFRFFYNKADLVLAISPTVKNKLRKIGVTTQIKLFSNPINTDKFKKDAALRKQGRAKLGIDKDTFVVLSVGQVQDRKGVSDFIDVASTLPKYTFVWVGGITFKAVTRQSKKLKNQLEKLPKNVKFVGMLPYDKIPAMYNAADVFFFPSHQENASMALLEAAAVGLPLLVRDLPEYHSLYDDGFLTAKTNSQFTKIIKKLAQDKEYYENASAEALNLAQQFSFENMADKLIALYKTISSKK